jgi:hypothetical protein
MRISSSGWVCSRSNSVWSTCEYSRSPWPVPSFVGGDAGADLSCNDGSPATSSRAGELGEVAAETGGGAGEGVGDGAASGEGHALGIGTGSNDGAGTRGGT